MANILRNIASRSRKVGAALSLLLASATIGGLKAYDKPQEKDNVDDKDKIEVAADTVAPIVVEELPAAEQPGTYGSYLEKLRPLEPILIADLIAKEGVNMNAKGLHTPYQCSAGKWTIGFGSIALKNGKRVTASTRPITTEEAYELARHHLEKETFFLMYCYDVASDKVNINTTGEALALASIIYNTYGNMIEKPSSGKFVNKNYGTRFELLRQDLKKYGENLPDSLVRQRFAEYPVEYMESFGAAWLGGKSKQEIANKIGNFLGGGTGIRWRRWIEAETLLGNVTPDMLLNCPTGALPQFFKQVGRDRANWFTGEIPNRRVNTKPVDAFLRWIEPFQNGASLAGLKKTKEYLPAKERAMCEMGLCTLGNTEYTNALAMNDNSATHSNKAKYASATQKVKKANVKANAKSNVIAMNRRGIEQ